MTDIFLYLLPCSVHISPDRMHSVFCIVYDCWCVSFRLDERYFLPSLLGIPITMYLVLCYGFVTLSLTVRLFLFFHCLRSHSLVGCGDCILSRGCENNLYTIVGPILTKTL